MPFTSDLDVHPPVAPLGVVSLANPTVYPVHASPDPHRMHYGILAEDGTLVTSTIEDRHHGEHTFIAPDPARFDVVDANPREAIYAGPLYHVYGHFIIESCQRLWWAAQHPNQPIVWTADEKTAPELNDWERDILEILGVHNEIIIITGPTRFSTLHVPDAGYRYADWSHPQHIAFLAAYHGPAQLPGTKLWLSRDPAHGRGVINRHIIERRLRELGWTIVTFELMPVRAQLDALARAEVVAGEEASTFHNLLLLDDIHGKRFHVFRRHGPEHLSFTTIGDARDVDQQFHSCSQDAVISVAGRAVVRLAPNPAQYLSHLGVPIPAPQPTTADLPRGPVLDRLNRLAGITRAQTCLQLGWLGHQAFSEVQVASRDIVDDEFRFDVRSYRNQGAQFYEVSLEDFLTWFAKGRTYDLVVLDGQGDAQRTVQNVGTVLDRAAHDRTVIFLHDGTDHEQTVRALRDLHPELSFRMIGGGGASQTVIWRGSQPRARRSRRPVRPVAEERALVDVQRWLFPQRRSLVSRLAKKVAARASRGRGRSA